MLIFLRKVFPGHQGGKGMFIFLSKVFLGHQGCLEMLIFPSKVYPGHQGCQGNLTSQILCSTSNKLQIN